MDKVFAGIDVSTQSIKIVLIDIKSKSFLYDDSISYDNDLPGYDTKNDVR